MAEMPPFPALPQAAAVQGRRRPNAQARTAIPPPVEVRPVSRAIPTLSNLTSHIQRSVPGGGPALCMLSPLFSVFQGSGQNLAVNIPLLVLGNPPQPFLDYNPLLFGE